MLRVIIGMAAMSALYLCFVLVRPRRECSGNCGSCATSCRDVSSSEESQDVSHV